MIVCHEWRFVFLKTQKTAGTSLEFALSALCGPDDILTPTGPIEEEHLRLGRPAQNYLRDRPGRERSVREDGVVLPDTRRDFWNHIPARDARRYLGGKIWNHYFKFAFVRNPWDREVSRYLFDKRHHKRAAEMDFRTYFLGLDRPRNTTWNIVTIDGKPAVDFVARYERIEEDLHEALARVGCMTRLPIPRAKAKFRTQEERDYRPFYDADTHARILDWYGNEVREFGYAFDPQPSREAVSAGG